MGHFVKRLVNSIWYGYWEESYRVPGLKTPRKRSKYLGPIDGPKRKSKVRDAYDAVRQVKRGLGEAEEKERLAHEAKEDARTARNNDLLTGKTISLAEIAEVAESQATSSDASQGHSDSQGEQSGSDGEGTAS